MMIGVGAAQFIFYYDIVAVKEGVSRKETHYRADLLMSEVLNIFPDAWVRLVNEKLCLAAVCQDCHSDFHSSLERFLM